MLTECWIIRRDPARGRLVLLVHVPPWDSPRGVWQPVTGPAEPGEAPVQAACRILWEKTALIVAPDRLQPVAPGVFMAEVSAGRVECSSYAYDDHAWVPVAGVGRRLTGNGVKATWALVRRLLQPGDGRCLR